MAKNLEMRDAGSHTNAVLVTGGSGFIGRHLVKKLATQGRTVVSMYHHRLPEPMAHVYPVCSDLSSAELLGAPLRGVDTVVHLAWETSFMSGGQNHNLKEGLFNASNNIKLLRNLLAAMEKVGTRRIILVSANGVKRDATAPFLQEKYVAEWLTLNSRIAEKIILRPSIVCGGGGNHDRFLKSVMNVMKIPGIYPVPNAQNTLAPLHVDDLAEILKALTEVEMSVPCGILEVVGNETFKVEDVFKMISERFAKGSKVALKGMIGETLLPLFERHSREQGAQTPSLKHYLSIGSQLNPSNQQDNPLVEFVPKLTHSFRDILAENQSM